MTNRNQTSISDASSCVRGRRLAWLAPALLILVFGAISLLESRILPPADFGDEPAFFNETCWIAEQGGAQRFPILAVRGDYPFDNRHPLVQLCASPVARRSTDAVRPMRAVKVGLAVLSLVLVFVVVRRVASLPAATVVIALLAVSHNWFTKSRILCAEPVVYAAFFFAWALAAGVVRVRGRWWWAGVMTGITYLAKGSAVLILISLPTATALWVLLVTRRRGRRGFVRALWRIRRPVVLFTLGFVLFAGPLLVRNVVRFGNPLHNYNSRLMWADDWGDHMATAEQRAEKPQTPLAYFSRTPVKTVVRRMVWGLGKQVPRFLGSLAPSRDAPRVIWAPLLLLSAALMLAGLWMGVRRIRSWDGLMTSLLVAGGILLFAWFSPITYSSRFAATLAPIVLLQTVRWWGTRERPVGQRVAWVCAVSAVLVMSIQASPGLLGKQSNPLPMSPEYRALMAWYEEHLIDKPDVCFQTPYLAPRYTFSWMMTGSAQVRQIPALRDFGELRDLMDAASARYLIIERDSFLERREVLGEYFEVDTDGALHVRKMPEGWCLHTTDPHGSVDYIIFERKS